MKYHKTDHATSRESEVDTRLAHVIDSRMDNSTDTSASKYVISRICYVLWNEFLDILIIKIINCDYSFRI